jgi:hypothetical protein
LSSNPGWTHRRTSWPVGAWLNFRESVHAIASWSWQWHVWTADNETVFIRSHL